MAVVRTTVEIFRPVPLRPVTVSARIERNGRRVQLLSASLIRRRHRALPRHCVADAHRRPRPRRRSAPHRCRSRVPTASTAHVPESDEPAFHRTGVEMRYARGSFIEHGPATVWMRLAMPVVAGETPTPLQRALAAADFGNGVSAALPWEQFVFINTDLTVYLHRAARGRVDLPRREHRCRPHGRRRRAQPLYDERGPIGHSLQGLFIDRLRTRPPGI